MKGQYRPDAGHDRKKNSGDRRGVGLMRCIYTATIVMGFLGT
jgi:hypothetical protein